MSSVTDLAQHLLHLDPQKSPARLALYHYLKNQLNPDRTADGKALTDFAGRALRFQYWQSQKAVLAKTMEDDLGCYPRLTEIDLSAYPSVREMSVVTLENWRDLEIILERQNANLETEPGVRLNFARLSDQRLMMVRVSPRSGLQVSVYPNLALIVRGRLQPVSPVTHLQYGTDVELLSEVEQILELPNLGEARFMVTQGEARGVVLRGYTFQKNEVIRGPLTQFQELFFALKGLEQNFVNPQTDPFYQELISMLEHAAHVSQSPHPEAATVGVQALKRGRLALKNIFPNDKLLHLLVTNLEFLVEGRRSPSPQAMKSASRTNGGAIEGETTPCVKISPLPSSV